MAPPWCLCCVLCEVCRTPSLTSDTPPLQPQYFRGSAILQSSTPPVNILGKFSPMGEGALPRH